MPPHGTALRFRSRIDWWLAALVFGSLGLAVWFAIDDARRRTAHGDWGAVGVTTLVFGLVLWLFATTAYDVEADHLVVRYGPVRERIPIASIRRIAPSRTLVASPALSFRRLELTHGTYDSVVISPADQRAFIAALVARNPAIEVRSPHDA